MGVIQYIQTHWQEIINVVAYLIAGASIIVKLTPTLKDDTILGKIKDFLSKWVALNPK